MEIKLYTTNCPNCRKLELKLRQKNIDYSVINDMNSVLEFAKSIGVSTVPILVVDNEVMIYTKAEKWLDTQEGKLC